MDWLAWIAASVVILPLAAIGAWLLWNLLLGRGGWK